MRKIAGSLLLPMASLAAVVLGVTGLGWLLGTDKGFGRFVHEYSGLPALFLPPVVMIVGWCRRDLSFWQTTFSGYGLYFTMHTLFTVGFGVTRGLFSAGGERAILGLVAIVLIGAFLCFPVALASSGVFHAVKGWIMREGYEGHLRLRLLSPIGWRDIVVGYAVASLFSLLSLVAAFHLYGWLAGPVPDNLAPYIQPQYSGYPYFHLFGIPFGAMAGVSLSNCILFGRSRVRVSAIAFGLAAGLGGVLLVLHVPSIGFWTGGSKGVALHVLTISFLCVVVYHYWSNRAPSPRTKEPREKC